MPSCKYDTAEIISKFDIYGDFEGAIPYGSGHINDTFVANFVQAGRPVRYILQKINRTVFKKPDELMSNVSRICAELGRRLCEDGAEDASRRGLNLIPASDGNPYYVDGDGEFWRVYMFIENAVGYDIVEEEGQAYEAAKAFGKFQKLLEKLPGDRLYETIPDFHNTPLRFRKLKRIAAEDPCGRADGAAAEIDFYLSYEHEVGRLLKLNTDGLLPERVTHNDTKLNNVLIDQRSNEALCVIDLDTSMPGLAPYDFGDLVRTSTTASAEDEPDLSKIVFLPEMFKALTRGYIRGTAGFLTETEADNLFFGGKLLTYETGLRFLTDYLEGDVYYKTAYDNHNLIRTRTQIELVRLLELHRRELEDYIACEYAKAQ